MENSTLTHGNGLPNNVAFIPTSEDKVEIIATFSNLGLTNIWREVYTEPVSLSKNLLENSIPLFADASHLKVNQIYSSVLSRLHLSLGLDVDDPEDDVPASAAVTAGHEAAAE